MCVKWEASNEHRCGNGNKAPNVHIIPRRPWRVDPGSHCDDAGGIGRRGRRLAGGRLAGGLLLGEGYLMPCGQTVASSSWIPGRVFDP